MNTQNDSQTIAARRQLTAFTVELADLRSRYDVLMNAFKFDEARAVHSRIEEVEREHNKLVATLPAPTSSVVPAPTPYRVATRRRQR